MRIGIYSISTYPPPLRINKVNTEPEYASSYFTYSGLLSLMLLTRLVVPLSLFHEELFFSRGQLVRLELYCQFIKITGEFEGYLIVLVVHRRSRIGSYVEGLVPLKD